MRFLAVTIICFSVIAFSATASEEQEYSDDGWSWRGSSGEIVPIEQCLAAIRDGYYLGKWDSHFYMNSPKKKSGEWQYYLQPDGRLYELGFENAGGDSGAFDPKNFHGYVLECWLYADPKKQITGHLSL